MRLLFKYGGVTPSTTGTQRLQRRSFYDHDLGIYSPAQADTNTKRLPSPSLMTTTWERVRPQRPILIQNACRVSILTLMTTTRKCFRSLRSILISYQLLKSRVIGRVEVGRALLKQGNCVLPRNIGLSIRDCHI